MKPGRIVVGGCSNTATLKNGINLHTIPYFEANRLEVKKQKRKWVGIVLGFAKSWWYCVTKNNIFSCVPFSSFLSFLSLPMKITSDTYFFHTVIWESPIIRGCIFCIRFIIRGAWRIFLKIVTSRNLQVYGIVIVENDNSKQNCQRIRGVEGNIFSTRWSHKKGSNQGCWKEADP